MVDRGAARRTLDQILLIETDECIIWPLSRDKYGYGRAQLDGYSLVHRLICKIKYGAPPHHNSVAAHSCNKGHLGCVNYRHLRWDSQLGNLADRKSNGTHHEGEQIKSSKLKEKDVLIIKAMLAAKVTRKKIAIEFGVTASNITAIAVGKTWRHVIATVPSP